MRGFCIRLRSLPLCRLRVHCGAILGGRASPRASRTCLAGERSLARNYNTPTASLTTDREDAIPPKSTRDNRAES